MKTIINNNRFFRDPANAKVSGVCAGFAKHFDINAWLVRGAAAISFLFFPFAIGLAYVLAVLLLKYK